MHLPAGALQADGLARPHLLDHQLVALPVVAQLHLPLEVADARHLLRGKLLDDVLGAGRGGCSHSFQWRGLVLVCEHASGRLHHQASQ